MIRSPESCQSPSIVASERESLQQEGLTSQNPSTVGFGRESLRQERRERLRGDKDRFAQDNNDLAENYEDVTLTAHSSDANMGLESDRTARLSDLERSLLNLYRETGDACSSANIPLIEGLIADIQSVASGLLTTGCTLIQYYKDQSDYVQVDALRLRYNPLITERADQALKGLVIFPN